MLQSPSRNFHSSKPRRSVAIIGAGISGNMAAHLLHKDHDITLFEKRTRLGGHSATRDIITPTGEALAVDTGFIVYNEHNYPGLVQLFAELDIPTQATTMSFGFSANAGDFEWSGQSLRHVFAQKRNILRPRFWRMLRDILKFNRLARRSQNIDPLVTMEAWLSAHKLSTSFRDYYLYPMAAAIWSMPSDQISGFPAKSLIDFFLNHRLTERDRPVWRTVMGGSRTYVQKLTAPFADRIQTGAQICGVTRTSDGVNIAFSNAPTQHFDDVIFACHSDQALALLQDATADEKANLSAIRYRPNNVYLHRDPSLMPRRSSVWSCWNYMTTPQTDRVCVTYWMNKLQHIDEAHPLFVTLNPDHPPAPDLTYGHYVYDHPQFDQDAVMAQSRIKQRQGENNTYFCGAWLGYGFHEDGLQSAVALAPYFDISWDATETSGEFMNAS